MAKKYLKNESGIVRAITSDNLQLEKPLLNENYDIEVHNRNMDKIDSAIQEVKGKIDGLELVASNVKMADGTNVETTVTTNKNNISTLQSEVSANKTSIQSANAKIDNNTNLANQALNKANEAFQRGDNVKTQLVDKLISEGLNVSTDNTFEELIGNIALGKKWASGTISTTETTYVALADSASARTSEPLLKVTNLGFKPSIILQYSTSMYVPNFYYVAGLKIDARGSEVFRWQSSNGGSTYDGCFLILNNYDPYKCFINDDGFGVPTAKSATNWIAFG